MQSKASHSPPSRYSSGGPPWREQTSAHRRRLTTSTWRLLPLAPRHDALNVQILFTNKPQEKMDAVVKWATGLPFTTGTRVGASSGSGSGVGIVILVVDTTRVVGYTIGTIADYLAMLTLSVVQSPEHCDPLPSILDLMSPSCGARVKPTAITAGDLAFLKALYYKNTGLGPSLSRAEIDGNMMGQFKLHEKFGT
jgi:hypothetical protein